MRISELTRKRTMGQTLLIATILNMRLTEVDKNIKAISICNQYGIDLETRVNGYSAHFYLGQVCNPDVYEFLARCDSRLKFNIHYYAFGVGAGTSRPHHTQFTPSAAKQAKEHANYLIAGSTVYSKTSPVYLNNVTVIDKIAEGAAHSGHEDYAQTLIAGGAKKTSVAGGAALAGNLSYVTKLGELYPDLDMNSIAFDVGFGAQTKETKEFAIKLINESNVDAVEVACGAAIAGLTDFVKELIQIHKLDVNRLIRHVVIGGNFEFAELLRKEHNADINFMACCATGQYQEFLTNIINNAAGVGAATSGSSYAEDPSAGAGNATQSSFTARESRPYNSSNSIFEKQHVGSWLDNKKMILDHLKKMFDESCKHYAEEINLTGLDLAGDEMKNCLISLIKQTLQLMINGDRNAVITTELQITINKAYRELILKVHPDKNSEDLKKPANEASDALNKFKQKSFGTKELVSVLVQLKPIPVDKPVDDRLTELLTAIDRCPDDSKNIPPHMSSTR